MNGPRGPIPKRDAQRRRRNKPAVATTTLQHAAGKSHDIPRPRPGLSPLAERWYESLGASGQAQLYGPSDWAAAQLLAEALDSWAADRRPTMLAAIVEGMDALLVTEGSRRRARLELEHAPAVDHDAHRAIATVTELRARLTAPQNDEGGGGPAA